MFSESVRHDALDVRRDGLYKIVTVH